MTRYEVIRQTVRDLGMPKYRYDQIADAVFKQNINRYSDIHAVPKSLRVALAERLGDSITTVKAVLCSKSKQAEKLLFEMKDGHCVETVRLSYKKGWQSFCISSQCGCACGCKFCATGGMGFVRNLTADEIADQLLYFRRSGCSLDSVSFMGMGEPLSNPEVFAALRTLTDPQLFGLSQRRITVSTVGIIPGIKRMTKEFPNVNIAFSLHAPTDGERTRLMPVNVKYPLAETLAALEEHALTTRRRVFLAYIMLDGVNDTTEHAKALTGLLRRYKDGLPLFHVDLIPYNANESSGFQASDKRTVAAFRDRLERNGISVAVRSQFGADINAACGQLAAKK